MQFEELMREEEAKVIEQLETVFSRAKHQDFLFIMDLTDNDDGVSSEVREAKSHFATLSEDVRTRWLIEHGPVA